MYRAYIGWKLGVLWYPQVMTVKGPILPFYKVHSFVQSAFIQASG